MSGITIMTDGVAGIPRELIEEYQLRVVPTAHIIYDGHSYIEGETISAAEAYQLLYQNPDKFNTSAISPDYLINVYREISKKSQEILFVTVSSALSAVSKSAALSAKLFQQESPQTAIRIVDSKTIASGQGLVVLAAARAAARGIGLSELVKVTERARRKTGTFTVDS